MNDAGDPHKIFLDIRISLKLSKEGSRTRIIEKEDLDLFIAKALFLGTIEHLVIRWLLKDRTYSLFDNLEHIFKLLPEGFQAHHI